MFTGTIRELEPKDVEAIRAIYALHWPEQDFVDHLIFRLNQYVDKLPETLEQKYQYFVAEKDAEILGVVGLRKCPTHMMEYTKTLNPSELYILAVKNKGQGVGKMLVQKVLDTAKLAGYTEVVLYSGDSHKESWSFYDHMGFERVGPGLAPNGEPGHIWRMIL